LHRNDSGYGEASFGGQAQSFGGTHASRDDAAVALRGKDAEERQKQLARHLVHPQSSCGAAGGGDDAGITQAQLGIHAEELGHAPFEGNRREDCTGSCASGCCDGAGEDMRALGDVHVLKSAMELRGSAWQKVVDGQVKNIDLRGNCRVCKRKTSYWCYKCSIIPVGAHVQKNRLKNIVFLCSPSNNSCYYTHCNDAGAGTQQQSSGEF
jgi:hypothetical protein